MLLDKDFLFDFAAPKFNPAAPVHQIAASYETTNHPEDVKLIREMFDIWDIEEDFYFFTSCSKRLFDICGEVSTMNGHAAALTTTINGVNLIAFDMAMVELASETGMTFDELMEHELIHLRQLESGALSMTGANVVWKDCDGNEFQFEFNCLTIMDPLNFDRSLAFQMALPWEAEAYAPEVSRGGDTQRAHALHLASELMGPARAALNSGCRANIDLVRWTELAMVLMIHKYRDYETAEEQLGYIDLDQNVHVRTNQMREFVKSLMCGTQDEFQAYCQRTC